MSTQFIKAMLAAILMTKSLCHNFAQAHKYVVTSSFIHRMMATPLVANRTVSTQQELVDGTFQVVATVFDSCVSVFDMWQTGTGGAIFAQRGFVTIQQCTFSGNVATYGGAMVTVNSIVTIINSQFTGNIAKSDAGAVWSMTIQEPDDRERYQMTVTEGNFTKNKAANYYGGMCCNFTHPIIQYCSFSGNEAALSVGGLGLLGDASAIVTDTIFQDNACDQDGTLACSSVWVQGVQKDSIFSVHFENTFFKSNLVNGIQKGYVCTYEQVQLVFRGYTCFDIAENLAFLTVKGEASYSTETIKYEVEDLVECKAGFPTDTFTASDIFTPSHAFTTQKTAQPDTSSGQTHEEDSYTQDSHDESASSDSPSPSPSASQSESPSSSSSDQQEESELNVPALAGSLLGLLLLIIIIIIIICCCCKKGCCPCCSCCKACCCCCSRKHCCRRKKHHHHDTEIRAPMLIVPKDEQHDDNFVIFVNPRCGRQDIHDSSDEDIKDDLRHPAREML